MERDDREKWRSVARVRVTKSGGTDDFSPLPAKFSSARRTCSARIFSPGSRWRFPASSRRPPPPLAEGLFDFQNYLATRGIYYQLKTESTNDWKILAAAFVRAAAHRPVS